MSSPSSSSSSSASSSSSSSFSPSPASSLSSAPSAWPAHLSTMNTLSASTRPPAAQAQRHAPAGATIAALPSLAHSLSAFPTMTVVTNDMVHYGMLGHTKGASEAKLNSVLRKTKQKQRQDTGPGSMMSASSASARGGRYPTPEDDEPVLLIVPKRSKSSPMASLPVGL
ncbi:hypothetical protein C8Q77DRAFT_1075867 [Trametes polyzona]|nr:hypothetical protein C8Q77DRAFT_1075867 [Trametes polyzona]